jgi:hypothetical protein
MFRTGHAGPMKELPSTGISRGNAAKLATARFTRRFFIRIGGII